MLSAKPSISLLHLLNNETATKEQRTKARDLVERLQSAAYAGRIKFRALKNGDNHVDGHKEVDHLYFSQQRGLRWAADEIWSGAPDTRFPDFRPCPPHSRWSGAMFILIEKTLRRCYEIRAFWFSKGRFPRPKTTYRTGGRDAPVPCTS